MIIVICKSHIGPYDDNSAKWDNNKFVNVHRLRFSVHRERDDIRCRTTYTYVLNEIESMRRNAHMFNLVGILSCELCMLSLNM